MRKALLSLIHIPFNLLINIRLLFKVASVSYTHLRAHETKLHLG